MLQAWLNQLCVMIPNVRSAIVVIDIDAAPTSENIVCWPSSDIDQSVFLSYLPLLKAKQAPVVSPAENSSNSSDLEQSDTKTSKASVLQVACPFEIEGRHRAASAEAIPAAGSEYRETKDSAVKSGAQKSGAVVLEVEATSNQQALILQMIEWGQQWLLLLEKASAAAQPTLMSMQAENSSLNPIVSTSDDALKRLSLIQHLLTANTPQELAMTLVTEIARLWSFKRVWIGRKTGKRYELLALSNTAQLDRRTNLAMLIEGAMAEAGENGLDGQVYPADSRSSGESAFSAHQAVLQVAGSEDGELVCLPLSASCSDASMLLCESDHKRDARNYKDLQELMMTVSPLIEWQAAANQSVLQASISRIKKWSQWFRHDKPFALPILLCGLLVTVGFLSWVPGDYRVSAKAQLEGRIQRAVVAPFDGYIADAFGRAGDEVQEGQVLVRLDDEALKLEQSRWLNQREEYKKQYRKELAGLNHSQARIFKAQILQAEAQLNLVENKLAKAVLGAPISGIVVEGDLSRALGAPVKQGQVLFELAPLNEYRIVLKVAERDVSEIAVGQTGTLLLGAFAGQEVNFKVQHIGAIHQEDGAEAWYRTEASIQSSELGLRPGMEGVGKVDVGERSWAWIALHRSADWLRLWFWSWRP